MRFPPYLALLGPVMVSGIVIPQLEGSYVQDGFPHDESTALGKLLHPRKSNHDPDVRVDRSHVMVDSELPEVVIGDEENLNFLPASHPEVPTVHNPPAPHVDGPESAPSLHQMAKPCFKNADMSRIAIDKPTTHLPSSSSSRIFPFLAIFIALTLFLKFLHTRCFSSPAARQRRAARRAERRERRALRRAARKETLARFFARFRCRRQAQSQAVDYRIIDEKLPLSEKQSYVEEKGTVTEEIAGFREAARLVDDMISVRSVEERDEDLPAYQDDRVENNGVC